MKGKEEPLTHDRSGQLLIVSALAIALLISSTTAYVYELSKDVNDSESSSTNNLLLALKQDITNAMISSIANVSNGGDKTVLRANLNTLSQAFRNLRSSGTCQLDFVVLNDSSYDSGTRLLWDTNGLGISSAFASFTFRIYNLAAVATANCDVNVTTSVMASGFFVAIDSEKLINLTCRVYNEGKPALADRMELFYEDSGAWVPVSASNGLSQVNYGDGTYNLSFLTEVISDPVRVLVRVYDLRGIHVQTTVICTGVQ